MCFSNHKPVHKPLFPIIYLLLRMHQINPCYFILPIYLSFFSVFIQGRRWYSNPHSQDPVWKHSGGNSSSRDLLCRPQKGGGEQDGRPRPATETSLRSTAPGNDSRSRRLLHRESRNAPHPHASSRREPAVLLHGRLPPRPELRLRL